MYQLSRRQTKELANGKLLRIALPAPQTEQPDWLYWAQTVLAVERQAFRAARLTTVWCWHPSDSESELERQIGVILRDDQEPPHGRIPYAVEVIMVDVAARDETRGSYPAQWPAWPPESAANVR